VQPVWTKPWIKWNHKTDRHDITEILLKVALNTIKQTNISNNSNLSNLDFLGTAFVFGIDRCLISDLSQVADILYHIMWYTSPWSRFELITSVVIGPDCIGSCKSNYHAITTTMALLLLCTTLCDKECQRLVTGRMLRCPPPIKLTSTI
jgi:hypothetical protein